MYAETASKKMESRAKKDRRWTDRTHDARDRLKCTVEGIPTGYRLKLAHGVDYGVWLELANEKRFAIIDPTIKLMSPEIMRGLRNLLGG